MYLCTDAWRPETRQACATSACSAVSTGVLLGGGTGMLLGGGSPIRRQRAGTTHGPPRQPHGPPRRDVPGFVSQVAGNGHVAIRNRP
eukprot:5466575-Prymnesium_polylepis.1